MLDFYLLGLARSGTTAFARSLNNHPQVYCGIERFRIRDEPNGIKFPDSFLDEHRPGNPRGLEHAKQVLTDVEKVSKVKVVGDKSPRKFFKAQDVMSVSKNLVIYRSFREVISSWQKRANNPGDISWPIGRNGLVFFWELYLFLQIIESLEDVLVVDYHQLFFEDYKRELLAVFEMLDIDQNCYDWSQFADQFRREKRRSAGASEPISDHLEQLAKLFKISEYEKRLFAKNPLDRTNIIKKWGNFVAENKEALGDEIAAGLMEREERSEVISCLTFFERYSSSAWVSQCCSHSLVTLKDEVGDSS